MASHRAADRNEEDGLGWGGLVPSVAEKAQERHEVAFRAEVREVLEGLRNLILRDGTSCWCDGRMTVTIGSHEEQCARARDLLARLTNKES